MIIDERYMFVININNIPLGECEREWTEGLLSRATSIVHRIAYDLKRDMKDSGFFRVYVQPPRPYTEYSDVSHQRAFFPIVIHTNGSDVLSQKEIEKAFQKSLCTAQNHYKEDLIELHAADKIVKRVNLNPEVNEPNIELEHYRFK